MSSECPPQCQSRMFARRLLAFVVGWAAMLFAALQLLFVPMPAIHALCGSSG